MKFETEIIALEEIHSTFQIISYRNNLENLITNQWGGDKTKIIRDQTA